MILKIHLQKAESLHFYEARYCLLNFPQYTTSKTLLMVYRKTVNKETHYFDTSMDYVCVKIIPHISSHEPYGGNLKIGIEQGILTFSCLERFIKINSSKKVNKFGTISRKA